MHTRCEVQKGEEAYCTLFALAIIAQTTSPFLAALRKTTEARGAVLENLLQPRSLVRLLAGPYFLSSPTAPMALIARTSEG
jgi:hypothetical protein